MSQKSINAVLLIAVVAIIGYLLYWQLETLHEVPPPEATHRRAVTNVVTNVVAKVETQTEVVVAHEVESEPATNDEPVVMAEPTNETEVATAPVAAPPSEPPAPAPPPVEAPKPVVVTPALEGAVVHGKVYFRGDPVKQKKIKTDADPKCAEMHETEPLLDESVIVNENNTLRNVFVYVVSGAESLKFDPPTQPVVITQRGCRYDPHVFGIGVGQPLLIRNDDDTLHNIHCTALNPANQEFSIGQPQKGMETTRKFAAREVMVRFKCDVHPWMLAYAGILDHPFFAVTGADGGYQLPALPTGQYVVAAWHEVYGMQTQALTVQDKEPKELDFAFKPE